MMKKKITVEVAYALKEKQALISLQVAFNSTILEAIEASKITQQFPEINPQNAKVGIFSKPQTLTTLLSEGDRVEIYRPLIADPKQARKKKAQKT